LSKKEKRRVMEEGRRKGKRKKRKNHSPSQKLQILWNYLSIPNNKQP